MRSFPNTAIAIVASFLLTVPTDATLAQTTNYQIVPHFSTLNRQGGFAGFNDFYLLTGDFDFAVQSTQSASFENSEIWGSLISDQPTIAIVQPIHDWLNFDDLQGTLLPTGAPFDVYQFTGMTYDGSDFTLNAAVVGPWMYFRGDSMAPSGGADFFYYDIQMLARTSAFADPNEDGTVDPADYTLFRDAQDNAGYQIWQDQFGESVPDMAAIDAMMDSALASVVPEPTTALLGLSCVWFFVNRVRRRIV